MFTGREFLKEVGLYDYRNRVYSQELGRFLQTDPIRFDAGDVNIYRYVGNRANWHNDPSGLIAPAVVAAAIVVGVFVLEYIASKLIDKYIWDPLFEESEKEEKDKSETPSDRDKDGIPDDKDKDPDNPDKPFPRPCLV